MDPRLIFIFALPWVRERKALYNGFESGRLRARWPDGYFSASELVVRPRDTSGDEVCRIFLFPKLPVASCSSYDRQNPLVFKFNWHRFAVNNEHILGRNQPLAGFAGIEYFVVRPDQSRHHSRLLEHAMVSRSSSHPEP